MVKKLPPLNWLRAFESSARHLSFTLAASELNLTQAAISKQIKNLEFSLGVNLFVRLPRSLVLSEDGAAYLPAVKESIDRLASATNELFGHKRTDALNVRVSLVFFNYVLAPKLFDFYQRFPHADLRFTSHVWSTDTDIESGVDMEIRHGRGDWQGLEAERLTVDKLVPVCSPKVMIDKPLDTIKDLKKHTLLHVIGFEEGWGHWLSTTGHPDINANRGMQFDTLISALQIAEHGMGVALGRSSLVQELIKSGKLVAPLEETVSTEEAFYLVAKANANRSELAINFKRWLLSSK
jgi:LysR family glycine cleavage system transcriptional activator